jgi:hypothetical protein
MALTIPCNTDRVIAIDEYLERAHRQLDCNDVDSIAASAPLLRSLANDRALVVEKLNERIETFFSGAQLPSVQSLLLGKGNGFYVRANIWPANSDMANGRAYQNQFAYNLAHDHNFTFMTVNYLGPGYETEIYEYDYDAIEGYIGEPVDLRFLEKAKFGTGTAMLYRAGRDVHIQYAPEELTVTLNLMMVVPEQQLRDQYHFDVVKRVIAGHPDELLATRRVSVVNIAGYVGNAETHQLLQDVAQKHPCRRTRLTAFEALSRQQPARATEIWESACRDKAPLILNAARRKLKELETG